MFSRDKAQKPNGAADSGAAMLQQAQQGRARSTGKSAMPSIVSDGLHVTGNMISEGDVQIDGTIEGDVKGRNLTVGVSGSVVGKVIADDVTINGSVTGEIHARAVTITRSAKVQGDITHDIVSIEAGAEFEGRCKRSESGASQKLAPTQSAKNVFQQLTGSGAAAPQKPAPAATMAPRAAGGDEKAASTGTEG